MARIQPAALPWPTSLDVAAVFGDGWVWGFGMGVVWVLAVSGLACFLRSVVRDPSDRCDPRAPPRTTLRCFGPTMRSAISPLSAWRFRTAAPVIGPKRP